MNPTPRRSAAFLGLGRPVNISTAVDGAGGTFTATYDAGQSAPHGDLSVEPHTSQAGAAA